LTPYRDINDEQWQRVVELFPELRPRRETRGRPLANTRDVLNGVLWVMHSSGVWSAIPSKYPSYQTCHRRFLAWNESGVFKRILHELYGAAAEELGRTMQMRMRKHIGPQRRSAHSAGGLRVLDSLAPALQAGPTYPPRFKHAA
jgi:transposase